MAKSNPVLCRGCWEQMRVPVPIRGPLALPLRAFGVRRSKMNPDICTICEMMFETVMRRRNIEKEMTILFADLRDYTALSQALDGDRLHDVLEFFYDACAAAIWEQDGLLNKTLGDGVMAIFNFPLAHADHADRAVAAAREIRRRCAASRMLAGLEGGPGLGVGIGVHCGLTAFGEFGKVYKGEVTAVGNVVNLAARLQTAAAPGEIVVSRAVADAIAGGASDGTEARRYELKGFAQPVTGYLM